MNISVEQKHIDKAIACRGKPGTLRSQSCAVAQALKDHGFVQPWVDGEFVGEISVSGSYSLPTAAREFILAFDRADDVSPIEFVLGEKVGGNQ